MEIGESNEVRLHDGHYCNTLESNIDMITNELQKVINEYNKIDQEKKSSKA